MKSDPEEGAQEMIADSVLSDSLLVQRLVQGDVVSFDTLFYRYYDRVYGLLFRLLGNRTEAEDLVQEVFLTLYRKPPRSGQEHNVGAWLYRVATNKGYNHLRGQKRLWSRNRWLVPGADLNVPDLGHPEEIAEQSERRVVVRRALGQLPARQAQLLLLRQMGLSYLELAEVCEVAPGSVGTLLSRAMEAFRKSYEAVVQEDTRRRG